MSEQNTLQTELEYFQKHKQEYLKLYKNQFVLGSLHPQNLYLHRA